LAEDFLTLWKDADPDIPIPKQAKTEYARLVFANLSLIAASAWLVSKPSTWRLVQHFGGKARFPEAERSPSQPCAEEKPI
jgi:hypothetical protein